MNSYPAEYLKYIELFNQQEFFEAHEVLEDLWQVETEDVRYFYQGLIQLAAICVHLQDNTPKGCPKIMQTAGKHLAPFRPFFMGLDLEKLLKEIQACIEDQASYPEIHLLNDQR